MKHTSGKRTKENFFPAKGGIKEISTAATGRRPGGSKVIRQFTG
jgi:hypothetical protein